MNRHIFNSNTFDLPYRYQPIKLIGKGTYGSVISANNTQTNQQCAIKKLVNIEDTVSSQTFLTNEKTNIQILYYFIRLTQKEYFAKLL